MKESASDPNSVNPAPLKVSGREALARFRAETGGRRRRSASSGAESRTAVPRRQKILVGAILTWFAVTLYWFRGGLDWNGITVSLLLGVATFLVLFLPVGSEGLAAKGDSASANLRRLLRFPMFWLGLYVLIYCGIQISNISWYYRWNGNGTASLVRQAHVSWLPSTGRTPFHKEATLYQSLLQIMIPWLMVCVVWAGITSRRAWSWLISGLIVLATAWSLMALWHYYTGQTHYFGTFMGRGNQPPFWGSIVNPNHGAFFQVLATFLCVGFAFLEWKKAAERGTSVGKGFFLLGLALFFTFATFQTASRGSILMLVLAWFALGPVAVIWGIRRKVRAVTLGASALSLFVLVGFVALIVFTITGQRNRALVTAWGQTLHQIEEGDQTRLAINRVAWRYAQKFQPYGSGLGTWGYRYRSLATEEEQSTVKRPRGWRRNPETGERERRYALIQFWYAHNDWLQALCELGWVGAGGLYLLLISPFGMLLWWIRDTSLGHWILLGGAAAMGVGSIYEFPLRTPAVGLLMALLIGLALVSVRFRRESRKP